MRWHSVSAILLGVAMYSSIFSWKIFRYHVKIYFHCILYMALYGRIPWPCTYISSCIIPVCDSLTGLSFGLLSSTILVTLCRYISCLLALQFLTLLLRCQQRKVVSVKWSTLMGWRSVWSIVQVKICSYRKKSISWRSKMCKSNYHANTQNVFIWWLCRIKLLSLIVVIVIFW